MILKFNENLLSPGEKLLWEYGIVTPDEIDLEAIAADRGLSIRRRPLDGADARLVATATAGIITVNASTSEKRQRFSIGHELGHWERDRKHGLINLCSKSDLAQHNQIAKNSEAEANIFSADLILPPYLVSTRTEGKEASIDLILNVAEEFRTSREATGIRIARLVRSPAMIMMFSQHGRKWAIKNSAWPHYVNPVGVVHHDSPSMDLLFRGANGAKTRDQKEPALRWLIGENLRMVDVKVQSVKLASNDILSIVRL
ncbi:ImmA/IrrE family metallo-endopeptidase [Noviherbaspirillum sedimenti]|uniref:ImmA/IrrE family metallo-endopeptidase n=1 Tax=Noviherbaspirillum sedimenti TaxID=2320865 RepID=A0A3A3GT19_9BURK|nr:ImmA/IrrE family metallo-endopeptidase [Noviherbaspirillum sedimenti]RJG00978.1 ImmA/IrrE family metallo-endopeptidase [Noviherbaspirillum sedimenti]RJG04130.1 ImmA/IrrE family metallo-endopeptidase [Noviherbaspirillum sedimenti]